MNYSIILNNIVRLNNLMYNPKNINRNSGDFNIISHNNYISILAEIILSEEKFCEKDFAQMGFKYDVDHMYLDDSLGKKWIFANTINYEMKHHRQILFEEIFLSEREVIRKLGFNPNLVMYIVSIFTKNNFIVDETSIYTKDSDVNHQLKKLLDVFSIEVEELMKLSNDNIMYSIQDRPIIKFGGKYLLSSVYIIDSNCRRILNYQLRNFEKFKSHKGKVFENLVFDIVKYYFDGEVYKNVEYTNGEADIVAEGKSDIYVIECKAIDVYDDFVRNIDSNHIDKNINDILKKTEEQGSRFFSSLNDSAKFKVDGEEKKFDNQKKKHIISISLGHLYGVKIKSAYDYINLSFSDFATILSQTSQTKSKNKYTNPFELINDLFAYSFNEDPLRIFNILLTVDKSVLDFFISNNAHIEMHIGLTNFNDYDRFVLKCLFDINKRKKNEKKLKSNNDWMHKFLTDEKFARRFEL